MVRGTFVFTYAELPPSSNKIYFNLPGGGRGLTTAAKAWMRRYTAWVAQRHLFPIQAIRDHVDSGGVLSVHITLRMAESDVLNKGWLPNKRGRKTAESRYKRIDVSNRVKLIEDATAALLGAKDELNFSVCSTKVIADSVGVTLTITLEDPRVFGVPDVYL